MTFIVDPTSYGISPGLDIVCSTLSDIKIPLSEGETTSADSCMKRRDLIQTVQDACAIPGFLAEWRCLSRLHPRVSLNSLLLDDVLTCMGVYERIRPGIPAEPTYFHMTISGDPNELSLEKVPPKVTGGTAWLRNHNYLDIQNIWLNERFPSLTPCIAFGWPGVQRKVIPRNDLPVCDALMFLTTVDLDLDRQNEYYSFFSDVMRVGSHWVTEIGTRRQSTALAAFLSLDLQLNVRTIQESWISDGTAAGNLGPDDVSASDWVSTMIGDSGVISTCGYEDEKRYRQTRTGLFTAVVMGNIHDTLYDIVTSNRLSSSLYASAAGVAGFNLHSCFVASITDEIARRVVALNPTDVPLFGDNALMITGPWVLFTERYRTWERFIKYIRILRRSNSPKARNILDMAGNQMVMSTCDLDDVEEAWSTAMTRGSEAGLTVRNTIAYPTSPAPEMEKINGLPLPDLCSICGLKFRKALLSFETDVFQAVVDLPASATTCPAVARAAAIRRAALYASDDTCCDGCACLIGRWADAAGYMVCGALMSVESATSASDWLLQCYAVWTVSLSPLSVMTVLSGFDLSCDVSSEHGSMGKRDVLPSWGTV